MTTYKFHTNGLGSRKANLLALNRRETHSFAIYRALTAASAANHVVDIADVCHTTNLNYNQVQYARANSNLLRAHPAWATRSNKASQLSPEPTGPAHDIRQLNFD